MELVFLFYRAKKKQGEKRHSATTTLIPYSSCYLFRACRAGRATGCKKGGSGCSQLPGRAQLGQDEQLKCKLSMFWRTHLPSLPFSKAAQYCHNWPCKILSYLSRGGGGTDLPRAPAVRTVNKITLFMCKHLSNSAHPVAQTQTSVTVQDQGIKTQTRKVEHLLILSLLTGIWLSLCCFWFKTLTLNSHTL